MAFTISTFPFLGLIGLLYYLSGKQLFPVLLFCAIFQGAAVVIIGGGTSGLALAPAQIVLVLLILQKTVMSPKPLARPKSQMNVTLALLAYGAYALGSAIFCPFFFAGIPVSNPRSGMGVPLTWSMYNVTQTIYLFLGIALFWLAVYRSTYSEIKRSLDWYLTGATVAAVLAVYQFVAFNSGLPFPSELFHSNTQHTIFEAYDMGGFTRVNSTFTEAAAAAGCFATALALAFYRLLFVECTPRLVFSLLTLLIGLVLTRSTTGYISLFFIVAAAGALYLKKSRVTKEVQLFRSCLALALLVGFVGVWASPSTRASITDLFNMVVATKTKSASYEERTAWNDAALAAGSQSGWLGAGWGSLRASSLLANILGTVGVPGLTLFVGFIFLDIRFASHVRQDSTQAQRSVVLPIMVSLITCLLAGPEMTDPVAWFLFGVGAFIDPEAVRAGLSVGGDHAIPQPAKLRLTSHAPALPRFRRITPKATTITSNNVRAQ